MTLTGTLRKLESAHHDPIEYSLSLDEQRLRLNDFVGKNIQLTYLKKINCIQCQRLTAKSFQQGYCYPCYKKLLDCNLCVIHPERCKHPEISCPDTWEHAHCKQDHIVYIANSSGLKVGITRHTQMPTRWIDQGATQAITLFRVSNRADSGHIEVALKKHLADKTNWRKMLSNEIALFDMIAVKEEILIKAHSDLEPLYATKTIEVLDEPCKKFTYPIKVYPNKLKTLSFDKESTISGELLGIKGQYLLFEKSVLNIRKHSGYLVSFEA